MLITVFTPTYNRKDTLPRLYQSLKNQSFKDFQWIVIDDGSQDGTAQYLKTIEKEDKVNLLWVSKKNGGKMRAINDGLHLAKGEYFFIVDSDDYLAQDALEKIALHGKDLPENMGGLVFRKVNMKSGEIVGGRFGETLDSTPLDIFYNLGIGGDKSEVIRTRVMKEYRFPEFQGEKFIPEGYVWNRIGEKYKLRYIDQGIYYYEYLEDGYTKNFTRLMKNNPQGFKLYYGYMLGKKIPLKNKMKFLLRYLQSVYFVFMSKIGGR
ncbi:MAG: glycosyltransferase family A protein [Cetobacterium sp.]